jgi:hypothetical protein
MREKVLCDPQTIKELSCGSFLSSLFILNETRDVTCVPQDSSHPNRLLWSRGHVPKGQSHNSKLAVAELPERTALERLGENASSHLAGAGTALDAHLIGLDAVGHEEASNVDVASPLAA